MRRRILLSDETVEARLQQHEKIQYRLNPRSGNNIIGGSSYAYWEAEIIGPFDSPFFGRSAFGSDKSRAVSNLIGQLARNGFIGRLVEVTGRGPHTDLVDHDPLSDEDRDLLDHVFSDDEPV